MKRSTAWLALAGLCAFAPALRAQTDDEVPEQRAYEGRMDAQIRSWIHEQNKEATDEERTFIGDHWKRAARIWRIRKLALAAKDAATVTRCDALLLRADHILEEHLRLLRGHAPVMTMAPVGEEVAMAPPPPRVEVQGTAPSPRHVWLPGYWQWNGRSHVWQAGHWSEPPEPGMAWEAPKWENRGGKWAFTDGRWHPSAPPAPTVVYEPPPPPPEVTIVATPPAPIVEVRPPGPANGVWIPGYWQWNGTRHTWVGGRWSAPKPNMHWEPDHWVHRGNQWALIHGRWAR